jgi:LacI family transcriptional regulator
MADKVSMNSIAKRLGISKNTVSLSLRGMPGISAHTRKLVLDTAAELGYQYKPSGGQEESARNLCLVVPKSAQNSSDFFSLIQMGIEDEAKKNNMNTILHYYDENDDEFKTPLCIKDKIVSGIITLGRVSENTVEALSAYELPIVMADNYFNNLEVDCVLTDNHNGGYIATEFLIGKGHTQIGFFGNIDESISFYDRYMGYRKAIESRGLKVNENIAPLIFDEIGTSDEAVIKLKQLMSKRSFPTAFVCRNDASAIILYKALKQMNISIPGQVSVIGFDDISSAVDVSPELTTMRVNKEWMGRKAVMKLLARLIEHDGVAEKLLLAAELVERDSVRCLKIIFQL